MIAKSLFIIFIVLFIILTPFILYFISNKQSLSEKDIINYFISSSPIKIPERESKIKEIFNINFNNDKSYAVVVKNFKTNEEFYFNEDNIYNSASLYKLWVLAVAMQAIRNGDLDTDQIISGDKNKLDKTLGLITPGPTAENPIPEDEEAKPVYISMKVTYAINKMITESDNYAALLLTQKLGYKNIDAFLNDYQFKNSNFNSPPKTNASDVALYFEQLYKGKIIDEEISSKMMEILKDQTFNDRIPKYLPDDIVVAHKTGELFGAKHDAGIVFSKNGDYMIIVLSQTDNELIAAEKTAKFSKDIFNYFED